MDLRKVALLAAVAVVLSGSAALRAQDNRDVQIGVQQTVTINVGGKPISGQVDLARNVVYIKSEGLPLAGSKGAQARWTAKESAVLYAARNLLLMTVGMWMEGRMSAAEGRLIESKVAAAFKGAVKTGKIYDDPKKNHGPLPDDLASSLGWQADEFDPNDGIFTVVMEAPFAGAGSVSAAMCTPSVSQQVHQALGNMAEAHPEAKVELQDVPMDTRALAPSAGATTGVIVDCRGLGLRVALNPKVFKGDAPIYGSQVNTNAAVERGIAGYISAGDYEKYTKGDAAVARIVKERVGASPMTVKAAEAKGTKSVALSAEDADKMVAANEKGHFFERLAVMFVINE
ncbi:MAG: hypothetical protein HY321_03430 [Armatimonadetes bacterium]|nr:hypothetical protein [Armatimonadota bacterium]